MAVSYGLVKTSRHGTWLRPRDVQADREPSGGLAISVIRQIFWSYDEKPGTNGWVVTEFTGTP